MSSIALPIAQSSYRARILVAAQMLSIVWAFVIPLSNAVTIIGSVGMLILSLMYMDRDKYIAVAKHPTTIIICLWLALAIIDSFHSIGSSKDISTALRKTTRLLYFPLILFIFADAKWRLYAVLSFLASVFVSVVAAWYSGWVVFKDPIFTSLFVSFGIFTVAHLAVEYPRYKYLALVFGMGATYYLLFLATGRTGQVLFLMMYAIFCWQRIPKFKHIVLAAIILASVFGLSIFMPSSFIARQTIAAGEIRDYMQKDELDLPHTSSMGMRLLFARNSIELIKMKPILGWGTGAFREAYKQYAPESQARKVVRANPHNQYLLTWLELGLPGLLCLLALFATLAWQFIRSKTIDGYLGFGFVCAIGVGCSVNSWLLDFSSMFFFILFASVFAAGVWCKQSLSGSTTKKYL